MAGLEPNNDYTPKNFNKKATGLKTADLRTALAAYNGTSYSQANLNAMTKRDMQYAAKLHGLSVPAL